MKIAILHPSLDVNGGAERQVLKLAEGLQKNGHYITIYVSKLDIEKCYPDLIKNLNIVECGGPGYQNIKKMILFSPYYMKKMAKNVLNSGINYDIINCHNYPTIYAAWQIKKNINKPIIWMCNEPPFPPLYKGENLSKSVYSLMYKIIISPFLLYNYYITKKIDQILVLDQMNIFRIKKTYHIEPKIIHTGLDFPTNIDNSSSEREKNKFVILTTGRIDKGKRTEDTLYALTKLKEIIPNIYLKIAGSGKELEKMKKISRKLNLDNYVKFYGLVSDQKMQELYSTCDIFLFTAENQSWGLVPLEAMSYGKPTIVSTGAGVASVLEDKKKCLKISPRDVQSIVKNVILLNENKYLANQIAQNGKNFVKNNFSWNNYITENEKIFYDELKKYHSQKVI